MSATRTPIALTQKAATLVDVRLGLKETAIYVKVQLNRTLYTFVLLLLLFVCLFVCLLAFCDYINYFTLEC